MKKDILSFLSWLETTGFWGRSLVRTMFAVILWVMDKQQTLTPAEKAVLELCSGLFLKANIYHPVPNPLLYAMVGLPGSGKTTAAHFIGKLKGAVVVSSNDVRVSFMAAGIGFDQRNVRLIVNELVRRFVTMGYSVVIDSDHMRSMNQENAKRLASELHTNLLFVRVVMDWRLLEDRILVTDPGELFTKQKPTLDGAQKLKLSEYERQRTDHYVLRESGLVGSYVFRPLLEPHIQISNNGSLEKLEKNLSDLIASGDL